MSDIKTAQISVKNVLGMSFQDAHYSISPTGLFNSGPCFFKAIATKEDGTIRTFGGNEKNPTVKVWFQLIAPAAKAFRGLGSDAIDYTNGQVLGNNLAVLSVNMPLENAKFFTDNKAVKNMILQARSGAPEFDLVLPENTRELLEMAGIEDPQNLPATLLVNYQSKTGLTYPEAAAANQIQRKLDQGQAVIAATMAEKSGLGGTMAALSNFLRS